MALLSLIGLMAAFTTTAVATETEDTTTTEAVEQEGSNEAEHESDGATDEDSTDEDSTDEDESGTQETDGEMTSDASAESEGSAESDGSADAEGSGEAVIAASFDEGCAVVTISSDKDISYVSYELDTGATAKIEGGFDTSTTLVASELDADAEAFVWIEVKSATTVETFVCDTTGDDTGDNGDNGDDDAVSGEDEGQDDSDVLAGVDERTDDDAEVLGVAVERSDDADVLGAAEERRAVAGELAFTGADHGLMALIAIVLLGFGATLLQARRRFAVNDGSDA